MSAPRCTVNYVCRRFDSVVTISFRGTLQMCPHSKFFSIGLISFISHFLRITKSMKIQIYSVYLTKLELKQYFDSKSRSETFKKDKINALSFFFNQPIRRLGSLTWDNQLVYKVSGKVVLRYPKDNKLSAKIKKSFTHFRPKQD